MNGLSYSREETDYWWEANTSYKLLNAFHLGKEALKSPVMAVGQSTVGCQETSDYFSQWLRKEHQVRRWEISWSHPLGLSTRLYTLSELSSDPSLSRLGLWQEQWLSLSRGAFSTHSSLQKVRGLVWSSLSSSYFVFSCSVLMEVSCWLSPRGLRCWSEWSVLLEVNTLCVDDCSRNHVSVLMTRDRGEFRTGVL